MINFLLFPSKNCDQGCLINSNSLNLTLLFYLMKHLQILIIGLLIHHATQAATYNLVKLSDPNALCLDGTPGSYYIWKGDPNKVILYFEGGGWCGAGDLASTIESCYQRSKGALGSSAFNPDTLSIGAGLLSDQDDNSFKDWTKVYLKYCDGSGHQGSKSQPINYKGSKLYFRGQNVTIGHFNSLEQSIQLFSKVENILVSGGSAGGLAAFLWTNYVKDHAKVAKVWSAPDSGIFIDYPNALTQTYFYRTEFEMLFKLSNVETDPPTPECVAIHPTQKHYCMFASNIHQFIRAPLFPIQSLYDSWSLPFIAGIFCPVYESLIKCSPQEMTIIEIYHYFTTQVLLSIVSKQENGAWGLACVDHVYSMDAKYSSPSYRVPMGSLYSANYALDKWMRGETDPYGHKHIDGALWPNNKPCSGTNNLLTE